MAIKLTKKGIQHWAMEKLLDKQFTTPGLCFNCPKIEEQKKCSLPPGLHPRPKNGKLPKWVTKIKPTHENLNLMNCLCTQMKDRTKTLAKLRLIAKELESFFQDENPELSVEKVWFYHYLLLRIYGEFDKLSYVNEEFKKCHEIYKKFKLYFNSFHVNPDSDSWFSPKYYLNESDWIIYRALPINIPSINLDSFFKKILWLASLLYTRIQLLSLNRKTDFIREGDDYRLKKLKAEASLIDNGDYSRAIPVQIVLHECLKESPDEIYNHIFDIAGICEKNVVYRAKIKREIKRWECPLLFGDQNIILVFNHGNDAEKSEFKYKLYCVNYECISDALSKSRKLKSPNIELEKFKNYDHLFLVCFKDESQRDKLQKKFDKQKLNCIGYTSKDIEVLFEMIKEKYLLRHSAGIESIADDFYRSKKCPFDNLKYFSFIGMNYKKIILELAGHFYYPSIIKDLPDNEDTRDKIKEKHKDSLGIPATATPDFINNLNNKEKRKRFLSKINSILYFDQKLIQQNFSWEPPKSLLDLLIAQFESERSDGDPQTSKHSVEDRDIRSIPEHFLHPCTVKTAGGKRKSNSWFVRQEALAKYNQAFAKYEEEVKNYQKEPESRQKALKKYQMTLEKCRNVLEKNPKEFERHLETYGVFNAAVIAVLVTAIHDWVVKGKITSETEIRASIRNTNDRLRRLRNILYPSSRGTHGRKSQVGLSVEERHKISTKDFSRALLADRREK